MTEEQIRHAALGLLEFTVWTLLVGFVAWAVLLGFGWSVHPLPVFVCAAIARYAVAEARRLRP